MLVFDCREGGCARGSKYIAGIHLAAARNCPVKRDAVTSPREYYILLLQIILAGEMPEIQQNEVGSAACALFFVSCYCVFVDVYFSYMSSNCKLLTRHPPFIIIILHSQLPQYQNIAQRTTSPLPVSLSTMDDDVATSSDEPADFLLESSDLDDGSESGSGEEDAIPASFLSQQRIQELRENYRRHPTDTGSPEYQVAGMTERISHLTQHLKEHPKDFSTRRGLVALVNKRRRLLNYLYKEDEQRYVDIVSGMGIRHKVPGAIPSKEDQYGRFPGQKNLKGKSKMKK